MKQLKILSILLISLVLSSPAFAADNYWDKEQQSLSQSKSYNFAGASGASEGGQNTSSLVEGKFMRYVEDAYTRRDEQEFARLYKFFRASFPASDRRAEIENYKRMFFYHEKLKAYLLLGNYVKLNHLEAKTEKELSELFKKMKQISIGAVELEVVQSGGKKVYLFSRGTKKEGFFFETTQGPVVENLINVIAKAARKNDLKVYVSMPVRSFPELSAQSNYILDESWNFLLNDTQMGQKLDLFNPAGKNYLYKLVNDLVKNDIDGIIFKSDFAYSKNEGFSKYNRDMFTEDTGIYLHFDQIFAAYRPTSREFGILTREEYWDIAKWKTQELQQSLWDLIVHAKKNKKGIEIGLEVIPEMILDEKISIKHYSTSLNNLKNLEVDFYKLTWRNSKERSSKDFSDYLRALKALRAATPVTKDIMLDVPLNLRNQNIIELNEEIENQRALSRDYQGLRFAIGTLDRYEKSDFFHFPMQEVEKAEKGGDVIPNPAAAESPIPVVPKKTASN